VSRRAPIPRPGSSLPELVAVLGLTALLLAIAVPRLQSAAERAAVRGAAADFVTTLSVARQMAAARGALSVGIDAPSGAVYVLRGRDTLVSRHLTSVFGVTIRSTRDSLAYDGRGLAVGAANLTFIVARGTTADTVVVSRLGRVRW
jgi:Tfp pilus assembly protein FimT